MVEDVTCPIHCAENPSTFENTEALRTPSQSRERIGVAKIDRETGEVQFKTRIRGDCHGDILIGSDATCEIAGSGCCDAGEDVASELKPARFAATSSLNALAKLKLPAVKSAAEVVATALAAASAPVNS